MSLYDFTAKTATGEEQPLSNYRGKVLLIVNTASKCGFTPQYEGLENLYKQYKEKGLEVLAFPCNQFGGQEPGDEKEIAEFCQLNYQTSFPLFAKVKVNGDQADPLFKYLKSQQKGILNTEAIKWNFTKFLVNREGEVIERFAPKDKPEDLTSHIEKLL